MRLRVKLNSPNTDKEMQDYAVRDTANDEDGEETGLGIYVFTE